jgi:crotonobetainyl-CoA:carnitine CoA-transferase CaiB-like acyl-CoA transferase
LGPVQTAAEAVKDPQLAAAGGLVDTPSGPMPAGPPDFRVVGYRERHHAAGEVRAVDLGLEAFDLDLVF